MDNENMMLTVSSSPHIRAKATTAGIMRDVVIALIPALIVAVIVFGAKALLIVALCVVTCVASEAITERIMHRDVTINDCSAVVTGILLAYNLPIQAPWWMCVVGSVFAIEKNKGIVRIPCLTREPWTSSHSAWLAANSDV